MSIVENYTDYTIKWATSQWEIDQAYELRRKVFCREQRKFESSDLDEIDPHALTLVALANTGGWHQRVVGTVRIHKQGAFTWNGSRLAVDRDFRHEHRLGKSLIRLAVSSAKNLGCQKFYATVQTKNVRFFKRLNWASRGSISVQGVEHEFMQADLEKYPVCTRPDSGYVVKARNRNRAVSAGCVFLDDQWGQVAANECAAGEERYDPMRSGAL